MSSVAGRNGIYGLYTAVWAMAMALASPYLTWRYLAFRPEMSERFARWDLSHSGGYPAWIHASSLGECRGVMPLIRALAKSEYAPLITVVTPTARGITSELTAAGAAAIRFAPLDFAPLMNSVMEQAKPVSLLITETEIWPALILEARNRDIPVVFINARLTPGSLKRLRLMRPWLRQILRGVFVCAQSDTDRRRWLDLGCPDERIRVTGNTKYERSSPPLTPSARDTARTGWDRIVVFGSVRSGEMAALSDSLSELNLTAAKTLLVFAPRHLELADSLVETIRRQLPDLPVLRRTVSSQPLTPEAGNGSAALVVQTMGELRRYYALADAGFVGGTFSSVEGHNLFEPADLETPVFYGPHVANVTDVAEMLEQLSGGFRCHSGSELGRQLEILLRSNDRMAMARAGAGAAATALGGAVERTLAALSDWNISFAGKREGETL